MVYSYYSGSDSKDNFCSVLPHPFLLILLLYLLFLILDKLWYLKARLVTLAVGLKPKSSAHWRCTVGLLLCLLLIHLHFILNQTNSACRTSWLLSDLSISFDAAGQPSWLGSAWRSGNYIVDGFVLRSSFFRETLIGDNLIRPKK